jgi:hypothetical protein
MTRRTLLLTLAGVATAVTLTTAQAKRADSFAAQLANVNDTLSTAITVDLLRWSTDAERDRLAGVFAKGDAEVPAALKGMESVGYLWTGDSVGYPLRYAYRQTMADGTERIILLTDRKLGAFSGRPWRVAAAPGQAADYPFAVIELRLPKGRAGEGKLSLAAKVVVDQEAKSIALDNYAAAPVSLRNVRRTTT